MQTPNNTASNHKRKPLGVQSRRSSHSPVGRPLRKSSKKNTRGIPLKNSKSFSSFYGLDIRKIVFGVLALIALVGIIIFATTSLKSCASWQSSEQKSDIQNEERIEKGTPNAVAKQLIPLLDRGDQLAWIAQNTSKYSDIRIVELAIREPAAISFVYKWPTASKSAQVYTDTVTQGAAPMFYCWDERWGNIDYGGIPLAVTGSGPCVLSMAYMGMTGKTDKTPADMAKLAQDAGYVSERGQTSSDFFKNTTVQVSLECKPIDGSPGSIDKALSDRRFVIAHVKDEKNPDLSHWILISDHMQNGAIRINDPTSVAMSSHEWDPATIKDMCDEMFEVSVISKKG